jgi:hypothetical protein
MKRAFLSIFGLSLFSAMLVLPVGQANADIIFDFANNGELDGNEPAGATMSRMGTTDTVVLTTVLLSAPDFGEPDPYTNIITTGVDTSIDNPRGLGINNPSTNNGDFNAATGAGGSEGNNINYLESITVDFDKTVTMTSIDFAALDGSVEFVRINVAGVATNYDFFNGNSNDIFSDPLSGLVITAGTDVTFTGLGSAGDTNMRIDQFTVETIAIPEPGSIAMLGLGSVLMMVRRRR